MPETTFSDVVNRFARSEKAASELKRWENNPKRAEVVPFVKAHVTSDLYNITPEDVMRTCRRTRHALGQVHKPDIENVYVVRDWNPAFAFAHVFHAVVEDTGVLPTWDEFREAASSNPKIRPMLWDPARELLRRVPPGDLLSYRSALTWRIGNAYYSFLKETYVLAMLRYSGLNVLYHPLADVLFRVDLFVGSVNISLFVGNSLFRSNQNGRKKTAADLHGDSEQPFDFYDIQLETRHRFGQVHLPSPKAIGDCAAAISKLRIAT